MKTPLFLAALFVGTSLYGQATPTVPPPSAPSTPSSAATDAAKVKREKRFSKLDANNDSFVDREEFKKARSAQKKLGRAEKRFARSDKNSDGKLSKEEWLAVSTRKSKSKTSV